MAANFEHCVGRIQEAAGRKLSDDEVLGIVETIQRAATRIRKGEKATASTGAGERVDYVAQKLAEEAAREHVAEADRQVRNASLQAVKLGQRQAEIAAAASVGMSRLDALSRLIAMRADGKMNAESIEQRVLGVEASLKRHLGDTWDALGSDFLGFIQDADKVRTLIRELRGENTGDAMARKGAQAWRDTAEAARRMFNDAGGEVGHLDDWGFPQHHSQEKVARAGKETWVNAVLPALDRSRYIDDFGTPWTEPKLREFLGKAWDTIATNGYANIEPGQFKGKGAVANRHAEARQIHFASADAYMTYWANFGEKTFPQVLEGHINAMARDVAMLEQFGPNPETTYRTLRDQALKAEAKANPKELAKAEHAATRVDNLWNVASGKTAPVANQAIAKSFQVLRDLNVAGKLGSAVWASVFGDKVMLETMSHLNGLPAMQRWSNELRLLSPTQAAERASLRQQGLMLDYMRNAMSRWGDDLGATPWVGKVANAVMRASGMSAINEFRRGAFGLSLMDSLGRTVAEARSLKDVHAQDMHLLSSYGINERDWSIWRLAQLEDYGHGNDRMLTPDAIARIPDEALAKAGVIASGDRMAEAGQRARQDAIHKLLGAINSESRYAVIEPGWRERAQLFGGLERGTIKGEVTRAFWQFKSFPIAQFERAWDVAMSRPTTGGKVGVIAGVITMTTLAGAMLIQVQDLLAGKDPRPMDWKFGLTSFIKGGALGIYGDFLYGINETRYGTGLLEAAAGPTIGPALDLLTSTLKAGKDASEGKQTHLAAKYLTIGKGFVPGSNLWYTKAATDHLIFQNLQEMLSPGYLASMRARTQGDFGQDWWWAPGTTAPQRAPNPDNALRTR